MEVVQHFGAREIDEGRGRETADDGLGIRRRTGPRQYFLKDGFRIDIKQRGLRTECDHPCEGLDVRISRAVGITAVPGSAEERDVRLRGPCQQQEDRGLS